jgi:hypothetical protein
MPGISASVEPRTAACGLQPEAGLSWVTEAASSRPKIRAAFRINDRLSLLDSDVRRM